MNFSFSNLMAGFVFGVAGIYFLRRGKKEGNGWSMMMGAALLLYPYFTDSAWLTWGIGIALFVVAWRTR